MGLSPRGRGKLVVRCQFNEAWGSIPAWAGETSPGVAEVKPLSVYPRVGGGNLLTERTRSCHRGLSPRGRGKLVDRADAQLPSGSIPAWAGETSNLLPVCNRNSVYPRVGGGNGRTYGAHLHQSGLSPRGRGKRASTRPVNVNARSIPAWAGETYVPLLPMLAGEVYPRVGGGNICYTSRSTARRGLSPRGRGKPP